MFVLIFPFLYMVGYVAASVCSLSLLALLINKIVLMAGVTGTFASIIAATATLALPAFWVCLGIVLFISLITLIAAIRNMM